MAHLRGVGSVVFVGLAALGLSSRPVAAQPVLDTWRGLVASDLETVFVQDQSGVETTGKLIGLDPDSLLVLVDGVERRYGRDEVARLQKRDSLRNGTIIGAIAGVGFGLIAAGISDCPGDDPGGSCAGFRATAFVMSMAVYTSFGAGLDSLIPGRRTIYARQAPTSASRARLGRSGTARGVRFGISW